MKCLDSIRRWLCEHSENRIDKLKIRVIDLEHQQQQTDDRLAAIVLAIERGGITARQLRKVVEFPPLLRKAD